MRYDRALIMPVEVAGYATRLSAGLKECGVETEVIDLTGDPLGYDVPKPRGLSARALVAMYRWGASRHRVVRAGVACAAAPLRVAAAWSLVRTPRLVVSLSGKSLLRGWDLRLARRRGSTVVTVFLGSDSRPPYLNGVHINADDEVDYRRLRRLARRTRMHVSRAEHASDVVVCNPLSAQFLSRHFVDWFAIGMPVDDALAGQVDRHQQGPIRVLHAPTRPRQKGSDLIEAAFDAVAARGADATFQQLTGVSNAAVRAAIESADLVVDELYSDSFMGGLGVEAAVSHTPCLTFGYGEDALAALPGATNYPLQGYGHPLTLEQRLERAINDAPWRARLADEAGRFVATGWSPAAVARRFLLLAEGAVPDDWVISPDTVSYEYGFGVPDGRLRVVLREYVDRFGEAGLLLPASSPVRSAVLGLARDGAEGDSADGANRE